MYIEVYNKGKNNNLPYKPGKVTIKQTNLVTKT